MVAIPFAYQIKQLLTREYNRYITFLVRKHSELLVFSRNSIREDVTHDDSQRHPHTAAAGPPGLRSGAPLEGHRPVG